MSTVGWSVLARRTDWIEWHSQEPQLLLRQVCISLISISIRTNSLSIDIQIFDSLMFLNNLLTILSSLHSHSGVQKVGFTGIWMKQNYIGYILVNTPHLILLGSPTPVSGHHIISGVDFIISLTRHTLNGWFWWIWVTYNL